jgi:hypothetical protein
LRSRKRLILTHRAPNRCRRPARIPVLESRVSLGIRAVLLQRSQRRWAQTQIELLRIPPIFRGNPEARAVRRSDRHPDEMSAPTLVPRSDQTVHFVLNDFGKLGCAFVETDEIKSDEWTIVSNIAKGLYSNPVKIIAVNIAEGWCRDVTVRLRETLLNGPLVSLFPAG